MDKRKGTWIPYVLILILGLAIAVILFYMIPTRYRMNTTLVFSADLTQIDNPLMGFAPPAEDSEQAAASELVYIRLSQEEWEPRNGFYDIEGIEQHYHIQRWKNEGKHAVLRFTGDTSDDRKYKKSLSALISYINRDHFVSFVEMGPEAAAETIASVYLEQVYHAIVLEPEAYQPAEQTGIVTYPEPVDAGDLRSLSAEAFGDLLDQVTRSNRIYLGPETPDLTDPETAVRRESLLRRMGYRIYVSSLRSQYDFSKNELEVTLAWNNAGTSAFYFDWPVTLHVYDENKKEIYWEALQVDLRELNADEEILTTARIPANETILNEYYIGISITDYDGDSLLKLAISPESAPDLQWFENSEIIYHYRRSS